VSKAFTKEDDASQAQDLPPLQSPLRPGERNFLTHEGGERLRRELKQLEERRQPLIALARGDDEARRELQALDRRTAYLQESLRTAVIVSPDASVDGRVRFGATVTVRRGPGETTRYRLVGVDETDPERNWVSWQSPIARALLNKQAGERVTFRFPTWSGGAGDREDRL
jgi:transcription elongation factor GreB